VPYFEGNYTIIGLLGTGFSADVVLPDPMEALMASAAVSNGVRTTGHCRLWESGDNGYIILRSFTH